MNMLMHGGMSIGFLLIALGVGYLVCAQAGKESKGLKTLGYIIGVFIIAISAIIILNKVVWFCGNYSKMCPLKGMMQQQMPMPIPKK